MLLAFSTPFHSLRPRRTIADVAGISIGSLYQYFSSKEAIGLAMVEQHLQAIVRLLAHARVASRGQKAQLRIGVPFDEVLREHWGAPELHRNLFLLTKTLQPQGAIEALITEIVGEIAKVLHEERPEADKKQIHRRAILGYETAAVLVHSKLADVNPKGAREDLTDSTFDVAADAE